MSSACIWQPFVRSIVFQTCWWQNDNKINEYFFSIIHSFIIEITGNPNVGFKEEDIEGDFDPKKYDEAMQVFWNKWMSKSKLLLIKNKCMNQKQLLGTPS